MSAGVVGATSSKGFLVVLETWTQIKSRMLKSRALPKFVRGDLFEIVFTNLANIRKDRSKLEMWANAQRDGRPAEHRWCSLFNAAKFG